MTQNNETKLHIKITVEGGIVQDVEVFDNNNQPIQNFDYEINDLDLPEES